MSIARVRGIEMAYDDIGSTESNRLPVVLLHGFPLNRSMWREQTEALRSNYRVITPDLRGHGETTVSPGAITMEEMAEDVAALLDYLDVKRAILGGLSMGGYVTFAFYRSFSERVQALVLADTRPQADTDEGRRNREELAKRALVEGMKAISDTMLPKLLAPESLEAQPAIAPRVQQMMMSTKPEGAAAALRGMGMRRDQVDLLPEISVPTLIIVGSEDKLTPPSDSESMREKIPGSRLETFRGVGHVSNIERPIDFNRVLINFLDSLHA